MHADETFIADLDPKAEKLGLCSDARPFADGDEIECHAMGRQNQSVGSDLCAHRAEIEIQERRTTQERGAGKAREQTHNPEAPISDTPQWNTSRLEAPDDEPLGSDGK